MYLIIARCTCCTIIFHIFKQSYHNCLDKLNEYFLLLEKWNLTERLLFWENVNNWKSKRTSVDLYTRFLDDQFLQTNIVTSMQPTSHFQWSFSFFFFFSWNSNIVWGRWSGCRHPLSCHCYWLLFDRFYRKVKAKNWNDPCTHLLEFRKPAASTAHSKIF